MVSYNNPYPAYVENIVSYNNPFPANVENMMSYKASKWQMGFNSAFKVLKKKIVGIIVDAGVEIHVEVC